MGGDGGVREAKERALPQCYIQGLCGEGCLHGGPCDNLDWFAGLLIGLLNGRSGIRERYIWVWACFQPLVHLEGVHPIWHKLEQELCLTCKTRCTPSR